jgi:purine-binding chemotaxis protein CheW
MIDQILVFSLDDLSYALPLNMVEKVIHAIEIRHLPNAPEIISGIINIKGKIIPVADIRKRFKLSVHELDVNDQLIIADTGKRQVAILVDTIIGIKDLATGQLEVASDSSMYTEDLKGVVKTDKGFILIYDLNRFLSLDEEEKLEIALNTNIDVS